MRCDCCNQNLNDYESTLKHADTGEYVNTCSSCLVGLNIPTAGRADLNPFELPPDDDVEWDFDDDYVDDYNPEDE